MISANFCINIGVNAQFALKSYSANRLLWISSPLFFWDVMGVTIQAQLRILITSFLLTDQYWNPVWTLRVTLECLQNNLWKLSQLYTLSYKIIESYNHRMVRVGRDLKDHLVPILLPWAGTSSTTPGCSELHPTCPWTPPGGGIHSFSGQPVPVFHHPHGEKSLPNIQSRSALY